MSNNSFSAAVENDLQGIDNRIADLSASVATGNAGAYMAESDVMSLHSRPRVFNEKEALGLAQGDEWPGALVSATHLAVQGSVYPTHDQHTSLLPQLNAAVDFVPFQELQQFGPSPNTGSFDSTYLPSTDFHVSWGDGVEASPTFQRPTRPLPIRAKSCYPGHLDHKNEIPFTQGWHNSQFHRNDHSRRDGFFAPQCPNAPSILPRPNDTYTNGNDYPYQNLYEYGTVSQAYCPQGSQRPYENRFVNAGPNSVYPTHSQHEIVDQTLDITHPAPSNVDHAPHLPADHYLDATAPSTSNSTVSTPASSSSVTSVSRPASGEPEEILFVTENVPCKWVISEPGKPKRTCGRLIKLNENPADHARHYHPPEYRKVGGIKGQWFCKWEGCQKWTSAALKRHLDGDNHTRLGRRVCGKCGGSEARFERIKRDHAKCTPGVTEKPRKKRRLEA